MMINTLLICLGCFFILIFAALGAAVLWWVIKGGKNDPRLDSTARTINGIAMLHAWLRHRGKIVATMICYDKKGNAVQLPHRAEIIEQATGETLYAYRAFEFNNRDFLESFEFRPDDGKIT